MYASPSRVYYTTAHDGALKVLGSAQTHTRGPSQSDRQPRSLRVVSPLGAIISPLGAIISTLGANISTLSANISTLRAIISTLRANISTLSANIRISVPVVRFRSLVVVVVVCVRHGPVGRCIAAVVGPGARVQPVPAPDGPLTAACRSPTLAWAVSPRTKSQAPHPARVSQMAQELLRRARRLGERDPARVHRLPSASARSPTFP